MKRYIVTKKNWYLASHVDKDGLSTFEVEASNEDEAYEVAWGKVFDEGTEDETVFKLEEKE